MLKKISYITNEFKKNKIQKTLILFMITILTISNIHATNYIYNTNVKKEKLTDSSSISVVAKPEFAFHYILWLLCR